MSVSYVEREQANPETLAFYDKSEERFQALLNIFKVFGHQPEYGTVFTECLSEDFLNQRYRLMDLALRVGNLL